MRNYFRGRRTRQKNDLRHDRAINAAVIINITTACFFWLLAILIAGIGEYPDSAWVMAGMFLPGLLFFAIRKSVKRLTTVLLVLNCASLYYPAIEFFGLLGRLEAVIHSPVQVIYIPLVITGAYFLLKTTFRLLKENLNS